MKLDFQGKDEEALTRRVKADRALALMRGSDAIVCLSFNAENRLVHAEVEDLGKTASSMPPFQLSELASPALFIDISSKGGAGLDGHRGEDGLNGAPGIDGENATETSQGTDGTPGEDGTDGNCGGSGSPGGDAGNIIVRLRDEDTDILAIAEIDTSGGAGGLRGDHGRPGRGGKGGKGGAEFERDYTYTVSVYKTRMDSIPSHNGLEFDYRYEDYQEEEARTAREIIAGGCDGRDGEAGERPNWSLEHGRWGKEGNLKIEVTGKSGIASYEGCYQLVLQDFDLVPSALNSVFEPGDTVAIENIKILNSGLMPTPGGQKFRISVRPNHWCASISNDLYVIDSIAPGESIEIPGKLFFIIHEKDSLSKEPTDRQDEIDLVAHSIRLEGEVRTFSKPKSLNISDCLEIKPEKICQSLTPGEVKDLSFVIRNRSERPIGPDADDARLQREIRCQLKISANESSGATLVFCDKRGQKVYGASFEAIVSRVDPGKTAVIEAYVKVSSLAPARGEFRIDADLRLEKYGKKGEFKTIQSCHMPVVSGVGYRYDPTNDFLLVVGRETSQTQLNAWKEHAEFLQLSYSTWDVATQGPVRVKHPAQPWARGIADHWQNKLIVIRQDYACVDDIKHWKSWYGIGVYCHHDAYASLDKPKSRYFPTAGQVTVDVSGIAAFGAILRKVSLPTDKEFLVNLGGWVTPLDTPSDSLTRFTAQASRVVDFIEHNYPSEKYELRLIFEPRIVYGIERVGLYKEVLGAVGVKRLSMANEPEIFKTVYAPWRRESDWGGPWPPPSSAQTRIALLASMPASQLVDHSFKVFAKPESSSELVDSIVNALVFKIWREHDQAFKCHFHDSFRGSPTLEHFRTRLAIQLGCAHQVPSEQIALFLNKVGLLRKWYTQHLESRTGYDRWRIRFREALDTLSNSRTVMRDPVGFIESNLGQHIAHIHKDVAARLTGSEYEAFQSRCSLKISSVSLEDERYPYLVAGLSRDDLEIHDAHPFSGATNVSGNLRQICSWLEP